MSHADAPRQDCEETVSAPEDSLFIDAWKQQADFDRWKWIKEYTWKVAGIGVNPTDFLGQRKACELATEWLNYPRVHGGPTASQRVIVEYLASQNGRARAACISTDCELDYEDPEDGISKMVRRINKSLSEWDLGFHLAQETDCFVIRLGARKTSKKRP